MVRFVASLMAVVLLFCAGCGKQPPSYAETVQIYTAEMQELTRLKAERDKLQESYEARLKEGSLLDKDLDISKQEMDWLKTGTVQRSGQQGHAAT